MEEEIKVFPQITLSDVKITEGTYGNESMTAVGSFDGEGGLFDKKFGMQVLRESTVSDATATFIYYAYKSNHDSAYMIQLRANNSIVIFNRNTVLESVTNPWSAIYLDGDCGVDFGSLYALELVCEIVDGDKDGKKDDTLLHVYINGMEAKGDNPAALYIVDGAETLGNNIHFYGHEKNTMKVWNMDTEVIVDQIKTEISNQVLSVSGTGTVKKEDIEVLDLRKDEVKEIRLEAGITTVSEGCFDGFTGLEQVYYANTVQNVDDAAFKNCAEGVNVRCVKGKEFAGGLKNYQARPYYSFKMVTIGSSFGEDVNTYIWRLAKEYYAGLPGRSEGDADYDEIVIAELYTGGGTLEQRVNALLGTVTTTCYYEKWNLDGTIEIPTAPSGQLTAGWMRRALQDEHWDYVMLMQSAADTPVPESFEVRTAGNGKADIDTVIDFVKVNNKNSSSKYLWLMTWSYNYKVTSDYNQAVATEKRERDGIVRSMTEVVQKRVEDGSLDGIVPAGASIDYLKDSILGAKDDAYTLGLEGTTGTYNGGNYSTYFALQRDIAHASAGMGRFVLGLTAFSYMADLSNMEILALSNDIYPTSLEEYEISEKLQMEQSQTKCYLKYDAFTEEMAYMAATAAIQAVRNPYKEAGVFSLSGDADGDGVLSLKDVMRYQNVIKGKQGYMFVNASDADFDQNEKVDERDLARLKETFVE